MKKDTNYFSLKDYPEFYIGIKVEEKRIILEIFSRDGDLVSASAFPRAINLFEDYSMHEAMNGLE